MENTLFCYFRYYVRNSILIVKLSFIRNIGRVLFKIMGLIIVMFVYSL